MELSSSNQSWCCFNFTDSFFKETTAELVKSPASLFHQPLHDSAYRHVHSFPSGNLHITEDKQNDLEEYKDDFMDESVARVKEERAKDAVDCKTVGFFLKISKEIGKAWGKTLTRAKLASLTRP